MADPSTYRPAAGTIPTRPGVYRFRDEHGRVIYVGKAKNLRSRLSSYFQDITALHERTRDRKSTRLNSSHVAISYAVFCLKKKRKGYELIASDDRITHDTVLST